MRESGVRKKPFYAKRALRKRYSWKVTCDVDVVFVHASKPRGGKENIPTPLERKLKRNFAA